VALVSVLLSGCAALTCLTAHSKDNQRIAAGAGALEGILCALRMGNIRDGDLTPANVVVQMTPAAVAQMTPANVALTACQALGSLVSDCAENAAAAARPNVFDALFGVMRALPNVTLVQGSALVALADIAFVQLQPDAAAAAARGVALVFAALASHVDETVQDAGIRAMTFIMVDNEETQQRAADAGAINWVVTCLGRSEMAAADNRDDGDDNSVSPRLRQLSLCCGALVAWTQGSAGNLAKCVAAGAIEAVVAAMRERRTEARMQAKGCTALDSIIDLFN
jgi:hypothetical protein